MLVFCLPASGGQNTSIEKSAQRHSNILQNVRMWNGLIGREGGSINAMDATKAIYIRNIIFGVEDSLVSTVGLLAGIASQTSREIILLTGIVYIFVEGFSMAVGSFLSEEATEEYLSLKKVPFKQSIIGSIVMFFSFVLAGLIPIAPYIFIFSQTAVMVSIAASIVALFILGFISGEVTKTGMFSRGLRMAILAGAAIFIGIMVGKFVSI